LSQLTDLPNIGNKLADELKKVGINSPQQLKELGSVAAALRISSGKPLKGYNMLYALEGAIRGVRWHELQKEDLYKIRKEYDKRISTTA